MNLSPSSTLQTQSPENEKDQTIIDAYFSLKTILRDSKMKFEKKLSSVLITSNHYPQIIPKLGAFWINDYIAANTNILSLTMNIKRNSLNCNLRHHQFKRIKLRFKGSLLGDLPDIENWCILIHLQNCYRKIDVLNGKENLLEWISSKKEKSNLFDIQNHVENLIDDKVNSDFDSFFNSLEATSENIFDNSNKDIKNDSLQISKNENNDAVNSNVSKNDDSNYFIENDEFDTFNDDFLIDGLNDNYLDF